MIDREVGLEYCAGSEEIYREVLEAYCEEGPAYLQKMKEYQALKDWKNYSVVVHTIKSNAKTIGALELSEAAKEQEMAAKSGDEETISAKWEQVYSAYQAALEEVKNMLEEEN